MLTPRQLIEEVKAANDSIGGVVCCVCRGVPAGWGEPCFDKLPAMLAHAMMSIPATKVRIFSIRYLLELRGTHILLGL
jgi:chorismate synthase